MLDPQPVDLSAVEPTPDSVFLSLEGAVRASGVDAGIALHYGSPLREGRDVDEARAVVDLSSWGVARVSGPDRLTWLNSLASQKLDTLAPSEPTPNDSNQCAESVQNAAVRALFLNLQGRIDFDVRVHDDGEATWLLTEPGYVGSLVEWLGKMRFMSQVEVADVTSEWAVVGARCVLRERLADAGGQQTGVVEQLEDAWGPVLRDPWPEVCVGGWPYGPVGGEHPGSDGEWFFSLVRRSRMPEVLSAVQDAGLRIGGLMAYEQVRIAAWNPSIRTEVDYKTIPHELDLLRVATHLNKGCYKGQETVARVHNLGHPPRRIVFLDLDGSEHTLPAAGAEVKAGERTVGTLTSAVLHHDAGPIALAVIRRNVGVDTELTVVDGEQTYQALQTVIVPPNAGNVVGRPKDVGRLGPGMGKDLRG